MAPELSSNWKKLQAQLKKDSATKLEKKRKAVPSEQSRNSAAKKRRLEEKEGNSTKSTSGNAQLAKKIKMGGMTSTEESKQPKPDEAILSATLADWAEDNDISARDLADAYGENFKETAIQGSRVDKINAGLIEDVEIGKYVGIDCEMVGVGGEEGADGKEDRSALARVSIVNFHGTQIYDSFVRPKEFVTDWRTHVSGVSTKNMATAREFDEVQEEVGKILKGRVIVGHALKNDLDALMLGHSRRDIRDTSKFPGFKKYTTGRHPSLKTLAKEVLGVEIQGGEHSSIEDARAAILLFRRHKSGFDADHASRFPTFAPGSSAKSKKKKKSKR